MPGTETRTLLDAQHARLGAHLEQLWAERACPRYLLEALGSGLALEELEVSVREALRSAAPGDPWWNTRALPLLTLLADVGYSYEGPQAEFWALAERRLGAGLSPADRSALSRLHELEAATPLRPLARPPATPWALQFCHIAWPITHAVLPLDLQRALVEALAQLPVAVTPALSPSALVDLLRRHRGRHASVRFEQWLEGRDLVHAVACGLLDQEGAGWLDGGLLRRIRADLASDRHVRADLEVALAAQGQLRGAADEPPEAPGRSIPPRLASLFVRLGTPPEPPRLGVTLPSLSPRASAQAREAGDLMPLLGATPPQSLRGAFSGQPLLLHMGELPAPLTPVVAPERLQALPSPLREEVASVTVDLTSPLAFSWDEEAGDPGASHVFLQVHGRGQEGERLVVLHATPPPADLQGLRELPDGICGCRASLVDAATEAVWDWLAPAAPAAAGSLLADWVGGPQEGGASRPRFHAGDPCLWQLGVDARASGSGQPAELDVPAGGLLLVAGVEEGSALTLASQAGSREVQPAPGSAGSLVPCALSLRGPQTIQALLTRELEVVASGPLQLDELSLSLEVGAPLGPPAASLELELTQVPAFVGRATWEELLTDEVVGRLEACEAVELRADLGGVARESWVLGSDARSLTWGTEAGEPVAETEEGRVQAVVACGATPWRFEPAGRPAEGEVVRLFLAKGMALSTGRCTGERATKLAWDGPARPQLTRSLQSSEAGVGLADLLRAYLGWALARPDHAVADFHRQKVVRQLDRWVAEAVCGHHWSTAERAAEQSQAADPWTALVQACRDRSTPDDQIGYDGYLELMGAREEALLDRAITRRLRSALPLLGGYLRQPEPSLTTAVVEELNGAFNGGYVDLAASLAESGEPDLASRDLEPDAYTPAPSWLPVFRDAWSRLAHAPLAELTWPRSAAAQLAGLDVLGEELERTAAALSRLSREHRGANLGESWPEELTLAALQLWCQPDALGAAWVDLAPRLLADRGMSRACRYVALRSRLARATSGQEQRDA